ncbi:hypothetical protein VNI00_010341 [Paramarasmius palmivorus]|uniref:Pleurotolysin B C-terminal domain-containing protein n=1 Tax=Paramarasmius palmivorus TaxID=297713 RepID=A0AAW0CJE9_9AGAR
MFPQSRIDFGVLGSGFADYVQLSTDFMNAINAALTKPTPPEKREALYNVFQEFGQVFRGKENESEVKQDIKVSLEGAVNGWGGGASAAHGQSLVHHCPQSLEAIARQVLDTSQYPKAIYRPKDAIPAGWCWLSHSADVSQAQIVKPTFALKASRNPVTTTGHESSSRSCVAFQSKRSIRILESVVGCSGMSVVSMPSTSVNYE